MYQRTLNLSQSLNKKSHFLLGPRATGKSWLVRNQLPKAQHFDLLNTSTFDRFLRRPGSLYEEINSPLVVIDEIQKLPRLLDEIHRLMEEKRIRFLLTGSSARKLRHGGTNLLAGRARNLEIFPLTSLELGKDFDLLKYCNFGGLPIVYQSEDPWLELRDYAHLYVKEEILAESLVRKVDYYARFLDVVGQISGEVLNFQQISSDSGVPVRTVANFIEILKDTLMAFELLPFQKTKKRKSIAKSKIFLFDVGVGNFLGSRKSILDKSPTFGKAFEHFIIQEVRAYLSYRQLDYPLMYWRTLGETHEVDCLIGNEVALEIKSSEHFSEKMLSGLKALKEEKKFGRYLLVSRDSIERKVDQIEIMPYQIFLDNLWGGKFF
ncbi:MAG: AAA family ATPase [Bacteriovoracaceae bacterium]|nr:AAA family ATPase [Bacteriovoracaceae bacterium]